MFSFFSRRFGKNNKNTSRNQNCNSGSRDIVPSFNIISTCKNWLAQSFRSVKSFLGKATTILKYQSVLILQLACQYFFENNHESSIISKLIESQVWAIIVPPIVLSLFKGLRKFWKCEFKSLSEFLRYLSTDIAAASVTTLIGVGCSITFISISTFVGIPPPVGYLISFVVSSIGILISRKFIEPLIKQLFAGNSVQLLRGENEMTIEMYESALETFGVNANTSKETILSIRRSYLLRYHPDKKRHLTNEAENVFCIERLIRYENAFNTIKLYREQENTWN